MHRCGHRTTGYSLCRKVDGLRHRNHRGSMSTPLPPQGRQCGNGGQHAGTLQGLQKGALHGESRANRFLRHHLEALGVSRMVAPLRVSQLSAGAAGRSMKALSWQGSLVVSYPIGNRAQSGPAACVGMPMFPLSAHARTRHPLHPGNPATQQCKAAPEGAAASRAWSRSVRPRGAVSPPGPSGLRRQTSGQRWPARARVQPHWPGKHKCRPPGPTRCR